MGIDIAGVTGGRASNSAKVQGLIKLLREVTDDSKSVAVGFGVSGPDQVISNNASFLRALSQKIRVVEVWHTSPHRLGSK